MWNVYLLLCKDGTLYAGVTTDLQRRLLQHKSGKGARYTRSRGAVRIVHSEPALDRSQALKREHALKRLSRAQKLRLVRRRRLLDTLRVAQ